MNAPHRILAATDYSLAGNAALARAGQLASQHGAQLTVLHAAPDWTLFSQHATARQEHYHRICARADELMREELSTLKSRYPSVRVRGEVQHDRATLAISRMVETVSPDLLIIGAGGEQLLLNGTSVLGGTALKLIARGSVPLLLVRTGESGAYQSALAAVPTDPETARKVLNWAMVLTGSGTCHLVRAYDVPYASRMRLSELDAAELAASVEAQRLVAQQDCAALVGAAGPSQRVLPHLVRGRPVESVLGQISQLSPELVVVGQHPHHPSQHPGEWAADLGTRIAYHCPTDVLVVP